MKKQSSSKTPATVAVATPAPFGHLFTSKKEILSPAGNLSEDAKPLAKPFQSDAEFDRLILKNRRVLFGEQTLGLMPNPISKGLGMSAYLFDLNDKNSPRLYFLVVRLAKGEALYKDFYPLMTELFAAIRTPHGFDSLRDAAKASVQMDKRLYTRIKGQLEKGERVEDVIDRAFMNLPKCLLVTEDPLNDLRNLTIAYAETWRDRLDIIYVRKYQVGKEQMISMHPSLAELKAKPKQPEKKSREPKVDHDENHHFSLGSAFDKSVYEKIKTEAKKLDKGILFNPRGKHYIGLRRTTGRNLAMIHFRKKGLYIVFMIEEKIMRKIVKHHTILSLPPSVKKFWGGECTAITISSQDYFKEVADVLKRLIKGK